MKTGLLMIVGGNFGVAATLASVTSVVDAWSYYAQYIYVPVLAIIFLALIIRGIHLMATIPVKKKGSS